MVADATSYKVTIRGDEGSWSFTVPAKSGCQIQELIYPQPCASGQNSGCAPPLKAGESYKLVVQAKGRSSEEEDLPNLGFTLLTGEEIQKVQSITEALNRLAIGDSIKVKMRASVYANNGLNAEAIRVLEEDGPSQRNPEALRLLGNLYLKIGLTRKAEALYLNLLKPELLGQDTLAGKSITHQTLGEIYEALGNKKEAIKYYLVAKNIFRVLGDRESTGKIESRLADLGRP
jgi:tetratricopeptide (TPR) repeat protein